MNTTSIKIGFLFFILSGFLYLQNANSQTYFGGGFAINTGEVNSAFGPQAKIALGFADKLELNGMFTYYLKKGTYYAIDFDLHYKLFNIADKVLIQPFAGLNFTRTNNTDSSLNLGASLRFPTEKLTYYIEPRLIFDHSQFVLSFGILI
ncbi:MAG: hypothetical protein IPM26_02195 [Saprospiraceae bacterium]|nr:hypothetical protein [Saprospiraceae bacterium]